MFCIFNVIRILKVVLFKCCIIIPYVFLFIYYVVFYFIFGFHFVGPKPKPHCHLERPIGPFPFWTTRPIPADQLPGSIIQHRPNAASPGLLAYSSPCVWSLSSNEACAPNEGPTPVHNLLLPAMHALAITLLHTSFPLHAIAMPLQLQLAPNAPCYQHLSYAQLGLLTTS